MNDHEAIAAYDAAGEQVARARGTGTAAVRWPDVDLAPENLRLLVEGVFDERLDLVAFVFGADAVRDHEEAGGFDEAWRLDAMHTRFAPEGVFLHTRFSVVLRQPADACDGDPALDEVRLTLEGELCLSFSVRQHARPFVDFMGGMVRFEEPPAIDDQPTATEKPIDPFSLSVSPQLAVAWGLNSPAL